MESGKTLKEDLVSSLNYGFTFFIHFDNLFQFFNVFDLITYVEHLSIMLLIHRAYLRKTHNLQIKEIDEKRD